MNLDVWGTWLTVNAVFLVLFGWLAGWIGLDVRWPAMLIGAASVYAVFFFGKVVQRRMHQSAAKADRS